MKQLTTNGFTLNTIRWILLGIIALTNIYIVKNPGLSFVIFLLPFIFALLHSLSFFGKKHTLVLFAIIMVVSFLAEYLGVHTGAVFGHYYYNASPQVNGFLVGGVPPLVTLSYVSMGYICYMLARIILGQYGQLKNAMLLGVPVLGALFMTMWDMSFDPIASYVQTRWIWETGGAYFGVPFHNFAGWFVNTFIIFLIMSLYLNYAAKPKDYLAKPSRQFLAQVIVAVVVNALAIVMKETTPAASDLQQAMALMALFGMGIPITIATFRLLDNPDSVRR